MTVIKNWSICTSIVYVKGYNHESEKKREVSLIGAHDGRGHTYLWLDITTLGRTYDADMRATFQVSSHRNLLETWYRKEIEHQQASLILQSELAYNATVADQENYISSKKWEGRATVIS